jgi:type IV secretory pathway VirB2 component (pilin)
MFVNSPLVALLEHLPIATIIAVIIAIVGAIEVVAGRYTWAQYQDDMKVLIGLLAVGRGAAAVGKRVVPPVTGERIR